MKRKDPYVNLSWPLYILFVAIGCVLAKVLLDVFVSSYDGIFGNIYVYDILLLLYGFVTCILFYQLGKLIFGKIAGFDVVYFNLCLIGFRKINGKVSCYFGGKENFAIRVELAPKKDKKVNTKLMLWGGTITTLVVVGITYGLVYGIPGTTNALKGFFTLSSIFYVFSLCAYMLPLKLDTLNDGFTLHLIRKYNLENIYLSNKRNLAALYDDSLELEYVDTKDNNDPISMEARINNFYYAVRKDDKELTKTVCDELSLLTKFVVGDEFANIALIAQAYSMCVNGQFAELKEYFWKLDATSRKVLRNTKALESLKVGLYISGKVDDSREGLSEIVSSIDSCASKYRYLAQKDAELKLVNEIKDKIYKENPELIINNQPVDNNDSTKVN